VSRRIPALVVSGFLGAGKTTLVRHLLADAQRSGVRLAVVSNEFGALGVDRALLGSAADAYVELAGGCVCCRLSDALVETLQSLWERVRPDRIVVETSGVALPFETQLNFWREPVSEWIEQDIAVVLVNAEQLASERDLDALFVQQVSGADLLLLNQIDRVACAVLPKLEARLRALEPDAPIVSTTQAAVDPALLFPPEAASTCVRRRAASAGAAERAPAETHGHAAFTSEVLVIEPGVPAATLVSRLRALGAVRAKGYVRTREGLRLVQGVGPRVELVAVSEAPRPELLDRVVVVRRAGA
jgi:cobalamin biosynthesis protein CobW